MNSERPGDSVFTDVEQALADMIVARSKKNCKSAAQADIPDVFSAGTNNAGKTKGVVIIGGGIKIIAALAVLLVLIILTIKRSKSD